MMAIPAFHPKTSSGPAGPPRIGISTDLADGRCRVGRTYGELVLAAGGVPILMQPHEALAGSYLDLCDGLILSGGDDPIMGDFGEVMHPKATPVDPLRQRFELKLLRLLDDRPDVPVLGVCLGMQYMALHAGGRLKAIRLQCPVFWRRCSGLNIADMTVRAWQLLRTARSPGNGQRASFQTSERCWLRLH